MKSALMNLLVTLLDPRRPETVCERHYDPCFGSSFIVQVCGQNILKTEISINCTTPGLHFVDSIEL